MPVAELDIMLLDPNPNNPRVRMSEIDDLVQSIKVEGVLQSLLVTKPGPDGRHTIIAGHRRHQAALKAGVRKVPVVISNRDRTAHEEHLTMLTENIQRVDLNPMEKADALSILYDDLDMSQEQISNKLGKSIQWVNMYLSFHELSEPMKKRIRSGEVTAAQAYKVVKENRAGARKAADKKPANDRGWEPDYFDKTHPLASRVNALCNGREHNLRRRIGKVGCGQCWERVIRSDEATAIAAERAATAPDQADASGVRDNGSGSPQPAGHR